MGRKNGSNGTANGDTTKMSKSKIKSRNKEAIKDCMYTDVKVIAKNESQKRLVRSIKDNQITICGGKAGCGKTFMSVGYALKLLRAERNYYQKIYLVKSVTTLKGEEVGFLKGDLKEKIAPFMESFFINMEKLIGENDLDSLLHNNFIKPYPIAYLRGASLDNAIIIIDEAQNVSMDNARTIMTRLGENSKMVFLGDSNQIDIKHKNNSCLDILINLFKDVEDVGTIVMDDKDRNVRNPLIDEIEDKFDDWTKLQANE